MDLAEKFDAKGKETGNAYHVECYKDSIERATANGTVASLPGREIYKLADGRALTPYAEGKFVIDQTGEKIVRV
ncbi:hypothetical protein [Collimonas sp.]|jgi:hypothetical protein|uniref:hypothetical protein n=1 Tax=Collimonas sp. TaxID=1963772 RepID=UPI002BD81FD4|nr:hypothetical protein [Collimonas sp.]HWW04503.1 hypothetical protein [Collimonas sp.]